MPYPRSTLLSGYMKTLVLALAIILTVIGGTAVLSAAFTVNQAPAGDLPRC